MSCLLDEFGRPLLSLDRFVTPAWVRTEAVAVLRGSVAQVRAMDVQFRIAALRESAGVSDGVLAGVLPERMRR